MNINEHDKEELEITIGEDLSERIIKMENVYVDFIRKRDKEIERLNNIINKAIEYIKDFNLDGVMLDSEDWYICLIDLLDILKGSDKK